MGSKEENKNMGQKALHTICLLFLRSCERGVNAAHYTGDPDGTKSFGRGEGERTDARQQLDWTLRSEFEAVPGAGILGHRRDQGVV